MEDNNGTSAAEANGIRPSIKFLNMLSPMHIEEDDDYTIAIESYDPDGSNIQEVRLFANGNLLGNASGSGDALYHYTWTSLSSSTIPVELTASTHSEDYSQASTGTVEVDIAATSRWLDVVQYRKPVGFDWTFDRQMDGSTEAVVNKRYYRGEQSFQVRNQDGVLMKTIDLQDFSGKKNLLIAHGEGEESALVISNEPEDFPIHATLLVNHYGKNVRGVLSYNGNEEHFTLIDGEHKIIPVLRGYPQIEDIWEEHLDVFATFESEQLIYSNGLPLRLGEKRIMALLPPYREGSTRAGGAARRLDTRPRIVVTPHTSGRSELRGAPRHFLKNNQSEQLLLLVNSDHDDGLSNADNEDTIIGSADDDLITVNVKIDMKGITDWDHFELVPSSENIRIYTYLDEIAQIAPMTDGKASFSLENESAIANALVSGDGLDLIVEGMQSSIEESLQVRIAKSSDPDELSTSDSLKVGPILKVDIVADNNRDGVISDADNQEPADYDETAYPGTWGAIYNVNLDRDSDTLPARQSDIGSTSIYFNGQGDAEDYKIETGEDINDITPFIIRKMPVPDGVKVWLTTDRHDLRRVHIFSEIEAGKVSIVGSATDESKRPELINGVYGVDITDYIDPDSSSFVGVTDLASRTALEVEHSLQVGDCLFGLEGLYFRDSGDGLGSTTFYGGILTLNLELRRDTSGSELIASDSQDMRVAPWLMTSVSDSGQKLLTSNPGQDNTYFRNQLPVNEVATDAWTFIQDVGQIGYTQRPGGDRLTLLYGARRDPIGGGFSPTVAIPDVIEYLQDNVSNAGGFRRSGIDKGYNDGGNIELSPPSDDYPLGRFYTTYVNPDRDLIRFIKSQGLQASFLSSNPLISFEIGGVNDADRLFAVGHVDEVVSFLPSQGQPVAVVPSPARAFEILDANPQTVLFQKNSEVPLFSAVALDSSALPSTVQNTTIATSLSLNQLSTGQDAPDDSSLWECEYAYVRIYDSSQTQNKGQVARIIGISKTDHTQGGNSYRLIRVEDVWETGALIIEGSDPNIKAYTDEMNKSGLSGSTAFGSGSLPLANDSFVLCRSSLKHSNGMPAILTAKEISADGDFKDDLLTKSGGLTELVFDPNKSKLVTEGYSVIELPSLFYYLDKGQVPGYVSLVPNPVNLQYWQGEVCLPEAFGPAGTTGNDLFTADYESRLSAYTLRHVPTWPDDPDNELDYHAGGGEVHCGSLGFREDNSFNWWEILTEGED